MKINISKEMYDELIKRCKKTKVEISGIMTADIDKDDINIKEVRIDINSIVENIKDRIVYNLELYTAKIVKEMIEQDIHISFHTHPGLSELAMLSYSDKKMANKRNEIAKMVSLEYNKKPIIVLDCIVNRREMAFYRLDENTKEIIRIPLFVDGKEIIPFHELTGLKYYYQINKVNNNNEYIRRK